MTGADPEEEEWEAGLLLTVFSPGVGTIVVTTRRLITLRTRGAGAAPWTGRRRG